MMRQMPLPSTADAAEEAFYDALARGDLEAVIALWADEEEAVCVHPGGPRLVGMPAIRASYERLLGDGEGITIRLADIRRFQTGTVAVHSVVEQLVIDGDDGPEVVAVLATNVYVRNGKGWQLIVHHATGAEEVDVEPPQVPPHRLH